MTTILRIDSSARREGSISRELTDEVIAELLKQDPAAQIVTRDLLDGIPFPDEASIGAYFTPKDARSDAQKQAIAASDELVAEFQSADTLVIGVAVYNYNVPGVLKAYVDQVVRVGETFNVDENGYTGLAAPTRAILVVAAGAIEVGGAEDFATASLRAILGFVGITDVTVVAAGNTASDPETAVQAGRAQIAALSLQAA